jgi:hydrogenase maturation protein HypF
MEWEEWLAPAQDLCHEEKMALRVQLERGLNAPMTSSMGRLFDAAAALAGVRQRVNYEAQAAIEFEAACDPDEETAYQFEVWSEGIDARPAVLALLADVRAGIAIPKISARFHQAVAEMVCQVCAQARKSTGSNEVALSGGVWQNLVLTRKAISLLQSNGFEVLIHHQVPANDGGVALGQALVAASNRMGK